MTFLNLQASSPTLPRPPFVSMPGIIWRRSMQRCEMDQPPPELAAPHSPPALALRCPGPVIPRQWTIANRGDLSSTRLPTPRPSLVTMTEASRLFWTRPQIRAPVPSRSIRPWISSVGGNTPRFSTRCCPGPSLGPPPQPVIPTTSTTPPRHPHSSPPFSYHQSRSISHPP